MGSAEMYRVDITADLLPGLVEDYQALAERSMAS